MKVDRAIFLAAGLGSRLYPITEEIPKPLVKVHGKRIIESLLDAVLKAGINEIYLILGYKSEEFEVLLNDYPMIKVIMNPDFKDANNISSLYYAGDLVKNAYIIESDLWLRNPHLITSEHNGSNYLAIPVKKTSDWCFFTGAGGIIEKLAVGGSDCEQMVGISYWNSEDGERLAKCTAELYKIESKRNLYWDQVALEEYLPEFKIKTRRCSSDDVIEIDTLDELIAIDSYYAKFKKN